MAVSGKVLSRWYRVLAQNLRAGFPLQKAMLSGVGPPVRDRKRMVDRLAAGDSLEEVLHNAPKWLPEPDRHIISAAAKTGRLPEGLKVLSEKHAFAAQQRAQAIGAVIYPLFVIHFGCLLVPLRLLIMESAEAYFRVEAMLLGPLWVIMLLIYWGARQRHRWLQLLLRMIPLLRGYIRNRSVADLCFTLGAYLAAGDNVDTAWEGAGKASGERKLARLSEKVAVAAKQGTQPSQILGESRRLPEEFIALYSTGEETGQLEENVYHLGTIFAERASARLQQAGFWYPKLLMVLVAAGVGYVVITSYMSYLSDALSILDM